MRERTKNDHNTPDWILDVVGPVTLDPCSNPWSKVDAEYAYSLDDGVDGLTSTWDLPTQRDGLVFVNPPYGRGHLIKWAEKASRNLDIPQAHLVPLDPTTAWSKMYMEFCDGMVLLHNRVQFPPCKWVNPKPNVIYLFAEADILRSWKDLGEVVYRNGGYVPSLEDI